jgi:hypothetical protein
VVLLAAAVLILAGVVAVAIGRGGELDPVATDYRPVEFDEVTSTDVALMRPPTALFGYHREATDAAFGEIARAISEREVEIATLRRQLAESLPVRTSPAMRADAALRDEAPLRQDSELCADPATGPFPGPGAGPARLTNVHSRPPMRLPAEKPADGQWPAPPSPEPQLPSRPVPSWSPPAVTKAGSLLPEAMPNSSMPHSPCQPGRGPAAGPEPASPGTPPGPAVPAALPQRPVASQSGALPRPLAADGRATPAAPAAAAPPAVPADELPSRPSVLHRELTDAAAAPAPAENADPWLVWQRRTGPSPDSGDQEPGESR